MNLHAISLNDVTISDECTVVIRYQPGSTDGWPWAVTHDHGQSVLTITDLDDSSIVFILRALAQARNEPVAEVGPIAHGAQLATT